MLPEALRLCPVVFVRIPGNQNICLLGSPLLPFSPTAVLASESTASVSVLLARRLGRGSDCGEGRFWLLPTIGLILGILQEYPMPRCAPRADCQGWCLYTSFTTAWDQKGVCHVEQRLTSTRVLWRMFTLEKCIYRLGGTSCSQRASCHYRLWQPFPDHCLKQEGRETSALSSVLQTKPITVF